MSSPQHSVSTPDYCQFLFEEDLFLTLQYVLIALDLMSSLPVTDNSVFSSTSERMTKHSVMPSEENSSPASF